MNAIEVCFSPPLFEEFAKPNSIVVVVDVFRATSAIVTAFHHGVKSFIPVSTIEEAKEWEKQGYLTGGERDGKVVEGFDFGNSPSFYMTDKIKGQEIVLTTTNGTRAINMAAEGSDTVLIGAFLNLQALADHLQTQQKDVIIFCSGWKNRFNMEDSLFAGALTDLLLTSGKFYSDCDSANASCLVYRSGPKNLMGFLQSCSHRKRLEHLHLGTEIEYCLQRDVTDVIPVLRDGRLVRLN